jgi:hypothetical protein
LSRRHLRPIALGAGCGKRKRQCDNDANHD